MIQVQRLVGGYSRSPILNGIDLEIRKGEFFALLGPNGSGKTTFFKLITGQLPILSGNVLLDGRDISTYTKLEKAKKVAVLTQEAQVSFDYTVEEIVSLGRYPHQKGILKNLSKSDWNIIEEVMELTKVSNLRKAQFRNISGGEKQRVLLAKALAQEPEILLLDEPTNHLDIHHTFQILDLLKERQLSNGLTIFSILHDLNIAALYADRFALLHKGRLLETGDVELLRNEENLKKVYEVQISAQSHPIVAKPQLLMTPNYSKETEPLTFANSYTMTQSGDFLHVEFHQPLRTISNAMLGEGIQWKKHFCTIYLPSGARSEGSLKSWLEEKSIPYGQAVFNITTGRINEPVILLKEDPFPLMVVVNSNPIDSRTISINTMVFMDRNLTDGALVNGFMVATEAKVKALQDFELKLSQEDTLVVALTQNKKELSLNDKEAEVTKTIREAVYEATQQIIKNHFQTV